MMICEKCEQELLNGTVICRSCSHNNVLQRIDSWRERRNHQLSSINHSPVHSTATTTRFKSNTGDATLIRFPKQPPKMHDQPKLNEPDAPLPAWKQKLNARLQEIRDQRAEEMEAPIKPKSRPQQSTQPERNPIVEAAISRFNRVTYLQPLSVSNSFTQTAKVQEEKQPQAELQQSPNLPESKATGPVGLKSVTKPPPPLVTNYQVSSAAAQAFDFSEQESFASAEMLEINQPFSSGDNEAIDFDDEILEANSSVPILEAASLKLRTAAAVIDAEIIAFSFLPLFAVYAFFGGKFNTVSASALALIAFFLVAVYFFLTYALAGRTIGMALLKLHLASRSPILKATDQSIPATITFTFKQAAARATGGTISLLLFPLNLFCITRNDDRLSISDYLSDTQIVRIRK